MPSDTSSATDYCRLALWNATYDMLAPNTEPYRIAKPRSSQRRPPNSLRPSQLSQITFPTPDQPEPSATTTGGFNFGQQPNGTSASASFPPFGVNNNNNTASGVGPSSSFNVPSSSFSFNLGDQSNQTPNPFGPKPRTHAGIFKNLDQFGNIIPAPPAPETDELDEVTSEQTPAEEPTNIFGTATSKMSENTPNIFGQQPAPQGPTNLFGQNNNTNPSNFFPTSHGTNSTGTVNHAHPEAEQRPLFGNFSQHQAASPVVHNTFGTSTSQTSEAKPNSFQNLQQPPQGAQALFGQASTSSPQAAPQTSIFGRKTTPPREIRTPTSDLFRRSYPSSEENKAPNPFANLLMPPAATQAPSSGLFGRVSGSPAKNDPLTNNVFSPSAASNAPNHVFSKAMSPPEGTSQVELPAGQQPLPTLPTPGQNNVQSCAQPDNRSPEATAPFHTNDEVSMMQMSPDASPQTAQKPADNRPFAFLNSSRSEEPTSPTKTPSNSSGKSLFDRISVPNQTESASSASASAPISGNLFGRISRSSTDTSKTQENFAETGATAADKVQVEPENQSSNGFGNSAASSNPKPTFSFPTQSAVTPAEKESSNSGATSTAAASSKKFQPLNNQMLPQASSTPNGNVFSLPSKPAAIPAPRVDAENNKESTPFKSSNNVKVSSATAHSSGTLRPTTQNHASLASTKMPYNAQPTNGFESDYKMPSSQAGLNNEEWLQFVTAWRLKSLDEGMQSGFSHLAPNSTSYDEAREFYLLKRQAILSANGGPLKDLDALTGRKRKAVEDPVDRSSKRTKPNEASVPSEDLVRPRSTTPTQTPAKRFSPYASARSNKRKASDEDEEPTSSGKRARGPGSTISLAKPSGSTTSGLFKNILQRDTHETVNQSTRPTVNGHIGQPNFAASTAISSQSPSPPPKETPTPFKVPSFGAPSGPTDFFSQFGQAAKENEDKERQKRKAEDYDSDEEDEAAWERRDAEAQRAKKKKIEEAEKPKARFIPGQGFSFEKITDSADASEGEASNSSLSVFDPKHPSHRSSTNHNIFGHLSDAESTREGSKTGDADDEHDGTDESGDEEENESQQAAPKESSPSLFDRVSRDANGELIREKPAESTSGSGVFTNVFGLPPNSDIDPKNPFAQSIPKMRASRQASAEQSDHPSPDNSDIAPDNPFAESIIKMRAAQVEKGDHTWSPKQGIKFGNDGATESPAVSLMSPNPSKASLGSLFGSFKSSTPSEPGAKPNPFAPKNSTPASTATGFGFGISAPKPAANSLAPPSAITSRATSPGLTTGESANESNAGGENDNAEKQDQLDLTAGGPGEENEDILFEARAKTSKWDETKKEWATQGLGPFRIMKNRETGVTRMLMRQDPSGRVIINSNIQAGVTYKAENKSTTRIPMIGSDGKFETWIVKVGKDSNASDLAASLEENKQKT